MSEDEKAQHEAAIDAMEKFQALVTIPILYDRESFVDVVGSGVLFSHEGYHFVLTAAHIFDPRRGFEDLAKFATPIVRTKARPRSFGIFDLSKSDREPFDFDIAVLELKDNETVALLKNEWQFLTLDNIALPTSDPLFLLGGYPSQLAALKDGATHGPMFVVRTVRLPEPPLGSANVDVRFDIFCEYAKVGDVRQLQEKEMPTPELPGTSGGSLMQYVPTNRQFWSPGATMKLVGIQSKASDYGRKWFCAKNWLAILNALQKHDATIAQAVKSKLGIPE